MILFARAGVWAQQPPSQTLADLSKRVGAEASQAYAASPLAPLWKDYFFRLTRDPEVRPDPDETAIEASWKLRLPDDADPIVELMAGYFADFMARRMNVALAVEKRPRASFVQPSVQSVVLLDSGGGAPESPESFTIAVRPDEIRVAGRDAAGLRDGVAKLVELIGLRQAPILRKGEQVYRPRLRVRLGSVPAMGSQRDLVFLGYNAIFAGGGSLYALSTSDAIPELATRRQSGALESGAKAVAEARRHRLKTYAFVDTRQKFSKEDPIFKAHPEIRGALTWKADGDYVLCTEHPLVRRFLEESVQGLFRAYEGLDGLVLIIGGEGFYHCYMRPFGVAKGHTNCPRCDPLGAETVVANLCNALARAARAVNPKAEIIAWPYSAEHVWSADKAQAGLIEKLDPGVAILTEMEKDEYVEKPEGVRKHLWDYSIDLIGPGARAERQIEACRRRGIPIYLKSEPGLAFEAPGLPHVPCMDRWADRAEALAGCGGDGAFVFSGFHADFGPSAGEMNRFFWWEPKVEKEALLRAFAARWAGREAAGHLREAWRAVSEAIEFSPELPSYYTGPYYLGPAHPMCADPKAPLPEVFYGYYLFMAEMTDAEGMKARPTFVTSPTGNAPVFARYYRRMEERLARAVGALEAARPLVPERCRLLFDAEDFPIRWFYATARTEANFYESCLIRDKLLKLAEQSSRSEAELSVAREAYKRWREVLLNEKKNAEQALPIAEADVRLDFYFGGDHTFAHTADMIRAKLQILDRELAETLPSLAARLGL